MEKKHFTPEKSAFLFFSSTELHSVWMSSRAPPVAQVVHRFKFTF